MLAPANKLFSPGYKAWSKFIPIMELPKVLENALQNLMDTNTLQTWSIFQDRKGAINVKLRFIGHHDQVEAAVFKRKTPKRVERDNHRAKQWKHRSLNQQSVETKDQPAKKAKSMSTHPQSSDTHGNDYSGVKTRSMVSRAAVHSTPEIVRSDVIESPLNAMADSFIMPQHSPMDTTMSSDKGVTLMAESDLLYVKCSSPSHGPSVLALDTSFESVQDEVPSIAISSCAVSKDNNQGCEPTEECSVLNPHVQEMESDWSLDR